MAYGRRGYGRGRGSYEAEERRQKEAREEAKRQGDRKRLARLLSQFRKVKLSGEEAQRAWKEPALRSFYGSQGPTDIIRGSERRLYLQQAGVMGWDFYRLVPRYHTLRE